MHFLMCALGTAGDVYPFVGMGLELRRRGHRVSVLCSNIHGPAVRRFDLDHVDLNDADDYRIVYGNPDTWHARKGAQSAAQYFLRSMRAQFSAIVERYAPGDTILVAQGMSFAARIAHDKLQVPLVTAHVSPAFLLSAFQPPVMPFLRLPRWTPTWLTGAILRLGDRRFSDPIFAPAINAFRAELRLPPVREIYARWIHSPQKILGLYPDWFCITPPDFPQAQVSHFPLFDARQSEAMPARVQAFVAAGAAPILFTTSTAMHDARRDFQTAVEACRLLKRRGVLLASSSGQVPADLPEFMLDGQDTRFDQLLPHAAAMVSHGGIGTASRALRAGVPQLFQPVAHDAFDNADRFQRLGVATVLGQRHFTAARMARQLERLTRSENVLSCCRELAQRFPNDPLRLIGDCLEAFADRCGKRAAART